MREKLKHGACLNLVHDLSSDKHLGVRLFDCSIPVTDISFKQLGKYVTLAINITVGSKDNAGEVQLLCQSTTLQMDL
ncbi:hypothetical protein T12_6074 [Trichinella patagoniensis]|uniref:Uncharacterized protein n=1 Tax=Trichinella patagoniensis TaxID=990121 RepID=A0A0V0Z2B0_9BILA|nr:hypothetical protein T12_16896 [Trichinella patagoniensis]KRY06525.1 hypothetical protein T12_6074 [Trichinella patagoniensis]